MPWLPYLNFDLIFKHQSWTQYHRFLFFLQKLYYLFSFDPNIQGTHRAQRHTFVISYQVLYSIIAIISNLANILIPDDFILSEYSYWFFFNWCFFKKIQIGSCPGEFSSPNYPFPPMQFHMIDSEYLLSIN